MHLPRTFPVTMYVCIYVCTCLSSYMCVHVCMCAWKCMCVNVCFCVQGCVCSCMYMCIVRAWLCIWLCIYGGVSICVCASGRALYMYTNSRWSTFPCHSKKSASYISLESLMVSSLSHRFHEHTCKQVSYLAVQFGRRDPEAGVCSPGAWLNTTLHSIHEVTGTALCSVLDPGLRSSCAS